MTGMNLNAAHRARQRLIAAVLRRVASERADESGAHYAAELEYVDDHIDALAAELVVVTEGGSWQWRTIDDWGLVEVWSNEDAARANVCNLTKGGHPCRLQRRVVGEWDDVHV